MMEFIFDPFARFVTVEGEDLWREIVEPASDVFGDEFRGPTPSWLNPSNGAVGLEGWGEGCRRREAFFRDKAEGASDRTRVAYELASLFWRSAACRSE